LRYDAHWLRQASGVIIAPEALTQPPNEWVTIVYHPLVGFDRLQGITHSLTAWEAAPSWVWPPSAPSSSDVTCSLPTLQAPRPQVFTTSRQDTVRNDLRVCSTPQALLGFGLQRIHSVDRMSFPTPLTPSPFRTLHGFLPDETRRSHGTAAAVLPVTTRFARPLAALQRPASIMGFDRPWSVAPNRARLVRNRVSPRHRDGTSLGLFLLQGIAP